MPTNEQQAANNSAVTAKRLHPGWRSWVTFIVIGAALAAVLAYFGEIVLWRPIMFSAIVIVVAVAVRWELHHYVWFWLIVSSFVALHVVAIALIPWKNRWTPAAFVAPFVIADGLLILLSFQIAEKLIPGKSNH